MADPIERPASVAELSRLLSSGAGAVRFVGGDTKPGLRPLSTEDEVVLVNLSDLCGVVEYQPSEFTVTVRGGERVSDVERLLAEHGQHLPFDPIFVDAGATIGGTIASGISGPGRLRFGGVRDFVLGVELVDGTGRHVRGGSRVVKNAAGFDLPKLCVGSAGRFGAIVEATLKVFPAAPRFATVVARSTLNGEQAGTLLAHLGGSQLDLAAVELSRDVKGSEWQLAVRIPGDEQSLDRRIERLQSELGDRLAGTTQTDVMVGVSESSFWKSARELSWARIGEPGSALWRLPITPGRIAALEAAEADADERRRAPRCYSCAGQVLWTVRGLSGGGLPGDPGLVRKAQQVAPARALDSESGTPPDPLARRVSSVFDPGLRLGD